MPRARKRAVGMGEVALEEDVLHADLVTTSQTVQVVEDAAEDPVSHIGGRRVGEVDLTDRLVPDAVHALELKRHPADLALRVRELETGELLERAAVDPVAHRAL